MGLYLVSAGDTFTFHRGRHGPGPTRVFNPVPQLDYVYSPRIPRCPSGLGLDVPDGLSLDWGYNPPFRNVAQSGSLLHTMLNPVIAWKVTPTLSIGIGPNVNYSKATLNQGVGRANDEFRFEGEDINFGSMAGCSGSLSKQWAFGINYHYLTSMDDRGHSTYNNPAAPPSISTQTSAQLTFPQYVVGGISFRPTEKWNIEFDYDWTDWDNVNQIVFQPTPLGNITFPMHYRSSAMYEPGATRKLPDGWSVSAGYFYSENSIPDTYFNPIIPDSALHLASFGFAHKACSLGLVIFLHHRHQSRPDGQTTSTFDTGAPGTAVNGTYKTINNALNFAVNLKF